MFPAPKIEREDTTVNNIINNFGIHFIANAPVPRYKKCHAFEWRHRP
jgi:hypothetical protein